MVLLSYHCNVSFKPTKKDLLFHQDTEARKSFYGITYVPFGALGGKGAGGSNFDAYKITDAAVSKEASKDAVVEITATGSEIAGSSPRKSKIVVTVKNLKDLPANVNLMIAISEDNIDYQKVFGKPAENGVKIFHTVFRQFVTSTDGEKITNTSQGSSFVIEKEFTLDAQKMNFENLRIVAFVQDQQSKEILGAFQSEEHPFQTGTNLVKGNVFKSEMKSVVTSNTLNYSITNSGMYSVNIYTLNGRKITLYDGFLSKGVKAFTLPFRGVYIFEVTDFRSKKFLQKIRVK